MIRIMKSLKPLHLQNCTVTWNIGLDRPTNQATWGDFGIKENEISHSVGLCEEAAAHHIVNRIGLLEIGPK